MDHCAWYGYRVPPQHEIVIEWITARIRAREYAPGARLPTIARLAELTGTSQTAVKTALMVLRRDGTIRGEPGKGTYVAEAP